MRYTLPRGVQGPFFNDDFGDVYGVIYALESDGFSYAEVKQFADEVRQQAAARAGCGQGRAVWCAGRKAVHRGLAKPLVAAGPGHEPGACATGPAKRGGERWRLVQTPHDQVQVRVGGQFNAIEDLRAMPIRGASGAQLRLGDIATIRRGYVEPTAVKVRHQGREVIALGVSMAKGGDIIAPGQGTAQCHGRIEKTRCRRA
jgi:multidrug efflux pump